MYTKNEIKTLVSHKLAVQVLTALDEKTMASADYKEIKIWDLKSFSLIRNFAEHLDDISSIFDFFELK